MPDITNEQILEGLEYKENEKFWIKKRIVSDGYEYLLEFPKAITNKTVSFKTTEEKDDAAISLYSLVGTDLQISSLNNPVLRFLYQIAYGLLYSFKLNKEEIKGFLKELAVIIIDISKVNIKIFKIPIPAFLAKGIMKSVIFSIIDSTVEAIAGLTNKQGKV